MTELKLAAVGSWLSRFVKTYPIWLAGRNKTTSIKLITDTADRVLDGCRLREQVVSME